jgi:hypothetical protein
MPAHDERETIRVTGGVGCTAGGSVSDLVQRLTAAAVAAIENERPALEHPVGRVVGLTIDGAGRNTRQQLELDDEPMGWPA